MIIDIHTHVFPDKIAASVIDKLSKTSRSFAFTDGTVNMLLNSMYEAQVNLSIILPVATNTHQVEKVNNSAFELNEKFADKGIMSFGCIHPDYSNYRSELQRIKNGGIKGIKVHPVYQDVDIDDIKYLRIFEKAAELDLIVITHAGLDIGFPGLVRCSPQMSRHVVNEIGNFKFVLAHMGGWRNWNEVVDNLADTNVYIDTAFSTGFIKPREDCQWNEADLALLNDKQFMTLLKAFGADRILLGTDSPWSSQTELIAFINQLPISQEDKNKILGINAKHLLNL